MLYLPKQIHYAVQQQALANKQTTYEWILEAIIDKLRNCVLQGNYVIWYYPTCPYCKEPYWVKESSNHPGKLYCKECKKTF